MKKQFSSCLLLAACLLHADARAQPAAAADVAMQNSLLHPPTGFDAKLSRITLTAPAELPWQKVPPTLFTIALTEYYAEKGTGILKPNQEIGADLKLGINSFRDLYESTYSPDIAKAKYPCPVFFFRYNWKMTDSGSDYQEFALNGELPIRAITNGKPLFVPLRKEQYLLFKIRVDQGNVDEAQKNYDHDARNMSGASVQAVLDADKQLVNTWKQRLTRHQQQLSSLSADERIAPVYIILAGQQNPDTFEELTTADDKNGQPLWTINPSYFNPALPATAIQLITVQPYYHPHLSSAFIKAKVMDLFKTTDYKKLKALIR